MQVGYGELVAEFQASYESIVCVVCSGEKWKYSPFCRTCSIRLQRAHLMQQMLNVEPHSPWAAANPGLYLRSFTYYARWWDAAKDYLINKGYEKKISKEKRQEALEATA